MMVQPLIEIQSSHLKEKGRVISDIKSSAGYLQGIKTQLRLRC